MNKEQQLIVIGGSPGCGKTTLAESLKAHFKCAWIDYGVLQEFHIQDLETWSDWTPQMEDLSFENLQFIVTNYFKHGYKNVIVDDLLDSRIQQIPRAFVGIKNIAIISLYCIDPEELKQRIVKRNEGWKNVEEAQEWNARLISRQAVQSETKLEVSKLSKEEVFKEALKILSAMGN